MESITFKPYAILMIDDESQKYGVVRFNTLKKDWEALRDTFNDINGAKEFINELNAESGNVTIPLENQ